jgi:Spy/CpxP family protein refolding chaperone
MKLTITILFAMAMGFAQTPARVNPAAPPSGDVKSVVAVKGYIGLTDAQVTALAAIHQNEMKAVEPIQEGLVAKEQTLRDALEKGSTDAVSLGMLLLDIAAARKKVDQARTDAIAQASTVMTPEQKTKAAALDTASKLDDEIRGAAQLLLIGSPVRSIPGGQGTGAGGPALGVAPAN